ncbi:MAG: hypothetical protein FWG87_05150 [Defluviitaleaceae bacterium]|nr:hypothetical protein [Defluviitaleaceae bacterium]
MCKMCELNADLADSRGFVRGKIQISGVRPAYAGILSGVSELSDFRGFYNEPIRVIGENPLNPCEALEALGALESLESLEAVFNSHILASCVCRVFCRGRIYPSRGYLALR